MLTCSSSGIPSTIMVEPNLRFLMRSPVHMRAGWIRPPVGRVGSARPGSQDALGPKRAGDPTHGAEILNFHAIALCAVAGNLLDHPGCQSR
jgi:hypothetical protein